jgi:peptidoglycan/LPS O-acetylase OafA/YrhL
MTAFARRSLKFLLIAALLNGSVASAFVSPTSSILQLQSSRATNPSTMQTIVSQQADSDSETVRIRGGGPLPPSNPKDPAAKNKKIRISSFDSMRFFLITQIVLGHFIRFAEPSDVVFKFFSHHNVIVGFFFVLSGYVTAYTTTENAQRIASPRLTETPSQKWILSKIFGYLPLHLFVLALFSPLFLYADVKYNGWPTAVWHGFLSGTMTQAWFPMHAEIWNAPTWFLSALTFATALFPFCLPKIAQMDKKQLRKTVGWLWIINLLPKIGYCYDLNVWKLAEGVSSAKAHPSMAMFNMVRFSPLLQVAEVLIGAVACRLVMLDGTEGDDTKTNALSTFVPLAGIIGLMLARATGLVEISDMLARAVVFVPLFLRFMMAAHRNTVKGVKDPLVSFLSSKFLGSLGALAFPIFVLHGPIGQVFYKKLIATRVFGKVMTGPQNFGLYLLTTVASAWIVQKTFLSSKAVANWSKNSVDKLSSWV